MGEVDHAYISCTPIQLSLSLIIDCCAYVLKLIQRKAILPIEAELGNVGESESSVSERESDEELDSYIMKIKKLRDNLFSVAKDNIDDAQLKQKRDYDRKHGVYNKRYPCSLNKLTGMCGIIVGGACMDLQARP